MKSRAGLAVVALSLAAASLGWLPSGAGQHFGIVGDTLAWGVAPDMRSGLEPLGHSQGSATGFLVFGAGAGADDAGLSARPITFAGCVVVTAQLGTDFACDQDLRLPPPVFDPTMGQAQASVHMESDRFPGAIISINLTFIGGEPWVLPLLQTDDPLNAQILIAIGRRASVQGTVSSSAVGSTQVQTNGIIAKGGAVKTCSVDGTACF